jgi:pyruvate-ferredoxin/flavodoxin oxidoreductase
MCVQVAPDDCVGCGLCVVNCPGTNKAAEGKKAINLEVKLDHLEAERANWDYFLTIPDTDRALINPETIKGSQLMLPLMEFSGACSACGETPYVKLVTQFFGDRMVIANATGCSSIYGGNLPTTPYCVDANGRGPAWCNSLFEDNAEFGLGLRLAIDKQRDYAEVLMKALSGKIGDALIGKIVANNQETEAEIAEQRKMIAELKAKITGDNSPEAKDLMSVADNLVRRSCWIFGGDGWAYDIGYGGLDHVLASGKDVNLLVMDTEVYSNTGGQASKATPLGAVAKFAAGGKPTGKKDLGIMAISYGNVYVGQIAIGANPMHAIRTIRAAESYRGPSLLIAFSHCIAQGIDMANGLELQKEAVACGYWPLYHYDPREAKPFSLDSKEPKGELKDFAAKQNRFAVLSRANPKVAAEFNAEAQKQILERFKFYSALAEAKTHE